MARMNDFMYENNAMKYAKWRKRNYLNKIGFFPIFSNFESKLKKISPGAMYLYVFIGLHSQYKTGVSYYSISTLSKELGKSERTISTWLRDLEANNLIFRKQKRANGVSSTYLLPYTNNDHK